MTSKMHRLGVLLTLAMVITLVFVLTHATPALSQGTSTVGVSNLDEPAARHTSMVGYTGTFHDEASAVSFCNGYRNRINTSSYGFSVNENAGGNTVVGTLAACGDPHRASLTYSVGGTDAAAFNEAFELQTNKGEIAVKAGASIDYERGNRSYSLTATVTDADDSSEVTIPMSITVRNVDDPGTIRLSTTDPWVGRHVSFSLSDPDGNPRIYRIEWSRADNRRAEFILFLPVDSESDLTQEIYTPTTADRWKLLKVTAYYADDECINVDSYTNLCRKRAEAVFANIVADEEGLRIASQMENSPATGRVVISAGRQNGAEIPPKIHNSLTVNVYNLRDADGVPFYNPKTYRWFRVDPQTLAEEEVLDYITLPGLKDSYVPMKADFGKSLNPNPPKSRGISAGAWVKDAARWRCGYDADAGAF